MGVATKYESDYYGWTLEQLELLRSGKLAEIDVENLIEELESMGASERRELLNRLALLMGHLLKWQYQPEYRGSSWARTIREQRRMIPVHIKQNPSLKGRMDEFMLDGYELGRGLASDETGLPENTFPESCPWTFEQAMNPDLWPE
ncbi:MAG: DUF29 domain-containing protein [Thiothrix sp.]|nr:DUF29 domain-containing protein [Thiothrix sp.]HPQ97043.1 DUF29 domain-containing protein [Thiolinea sp.]